VFKFLKIAAIALCLIANLLTTDAAGADLKLPQEVVFVPKKILLGTLELETTIFKPEGPGPFPLVVINHGKAPGSPGLQARYIPGWAARYFLERNYIVMVPMRSGFSKSTGNYIGGGCNVESNGQAQAEDVAATVAYAHTLPDVDKEVTLIIGQSHGGWTTLAYGASNPDPSVRGLVNFAGGLKQTDCLGWDLNLASAAGNYADKTKVPSLWFYGDNDSFFSRTVSDNMFKHYHAAQPNSAFVAFGAFKQDAHSLFGHKDGRAIWEPHLEQFLKQLGLPTAVVNPQYKPTSE